MLPVHVRRYQMMYTCAMVYGRYSGERFEGILCYSNMKTLTSSQLCPEATAGAPMRKAASLWTNDFVHESVNSDRWVGMCFLLALPNLEQVSLKMTSSVMVVDGLTRSTQGSHSYIH